MKKQKKSKGNLPGEMLHLDELRSKIKSKAWEDRFFSLKEIGSQKISELLPEVLESLNDSKSKVRRMAAWASGEIGNSTITETLVTAMADPDEWVRVTLVESLGKIGDRRICLIVSQFLENEEDEKVRATLIKVLGFLGDVSLIPTIATYLKDPDNRVTANAIEAIGRLNPGRENSSDLILKFLNHHDNRIIANTAKALWDMGQTDEALTALLEMLQSPHAAMKSSAIYMLGEIRTPRAVIPLIRALSEELWIVRKNVLGALKKYLDIALSDIIKAADDPDPRVRAGAIFVLGSKLDHPRARKAVVYALQDENGEVRARAEEILDQEKHPLFRS